MSFRDSFRTSLWGYLDHDIVLNRLGELYTPLDAAEHPTSWEHEPDSRFSVNSSNYEPLSSYSYYSNAILSRLSQLPQLTQKRLLREKELPPLPTTYAVSRQPRGHACHGSANFEDNMERERSSLPKHEARPQARSAMPIAMGMSWSRETLFVVTVCMAQLCAQAGIGQTLPILNVIGITFGIETSNMSWAAAGYALALGTFILIAGRLGDIFGYKRMFIIGFIWSAVWSAVVGASFYSTDVMFMISRALQGSGAALTLPSGLALLGMAYPPGKRKAFAFTLFATMSPIGFIAGAAGASALTVLWWPLAYWAFSLTLLVVAFVGYLVIPKSVQSNKTPSGTRAVMVDLDIPGMLAGLSSLVMIGFAWNQAPSVGWHQQYLWIALIVGVLLAIVFVLVEMYYAPKPMIEFHVLSSDVSFVLIAVGCGWASSGIWAFYTWQFVENFRGINPLMSTAYFSPIVVVGCLAVVTTGLTLNRLGPLTMICISLFTLTVGSVLVVTMPITQTYWAQLFISTLAVAWGMDTSLPAAALLLSDKVVKQYHGAMIRLMSSVSYCGMALGLGIAGTVESNVDNGGSTVKNQLKGYRAALWTGVGLAGLGLLVCVALSIKINQRKRQLKRTQCCNCHGVLEGHQRT